MKDNSIAQTVSKPSAKPFFRQSTKQLTPYLLIAPVVLILAVLLAYPWAVGFYTGLTDLRIGRWDQAQFVGLKNYIWLITSGEFFSAAKVTFTLVIMCVIAEMSLGLGLALLLNRNIRGINIYRAICLIPFMTPTVVCGLVWRQLLAVEGVINYIFGPLGLTGFPWLTSTKTVLFGLLVIDVWQTTPQVIILLLAGLQTIPQDIYEVAKIDGASNWKLFRFVIFPLILPYFLVSLMIRSIELIQVLDIVMVTTAGGPADASRVLHLGAYRETFVAGFLGNGTAWAFLLGFVVALVALAIARQFQAAQAAAFGE